jgi:Protein of unknown function (DUF1688)
VEKKMGLFKKRNKSASSKGSADPSPSSALPLNGAFHARMSSGGIMSSSSSQQRNSQQDRASCASTTTRSTTTIDNGPVVSSSPPPPAPDPTVDAVGFLRSLVAVRQRCGVIMEKAKKNELGHFDVDMGKFDDAIKWVVSIIKVSRISGVDYRYSFV